MAGGAGADDDGAGADDDGLCSGFGLAVSVHLDKATPTTASTANARRLRQSYTVDPQDRRLSHEGTGPHSP